MKTLKSAIESIVNQLYGIKFEYDETKMFNSNADSLTFPCCFMPPISNGKINFTYNISNAGRIVLYFMELVELDASMYEKCAKQDLLIESFILPFIKKISDPTNGFKPISTFNYDFSVPSMTDANEISVMISFDAELFETTCLASISIPKAPVDENV